MSKIQVLLCLFTISIQFICCQDIIISVGSSLYNDGYGSSSKIENINIITQETIFSSRNTFGIESPAFSNKQYMYSINPWPNNDKITKLQLQTESKSHTTSKLSQLICNSVASSIYFDKAEKMFILSSITEKNEKNETICIKSWNIYEITKDNEIHLISNSPFKDSNLEPLNWMAFNENKEEFIFFLPNQTEETGGSFLIQQNDFTIITSENFKFTFYSIVWLSENQIIGPCVDDMNSFGLCVGNYSSGSVNQIISLATSYNPLLTSCYLNKELNLFIFASQLSPIDFQQIQLYVVNTTNFELFSSISYSLDSFYRLSGLYIFPSDPDHFSESLIIETYSNNNSSLSLTTTFVKLDTHTFYIIASCIIAITIVGILIGIGSSALYFYLYNKFT